MADVKVEVVCPSCKQTRVVSRSMFNFIQAGTNTGCCQSCSLKGNKYRLGTHCSEETKSKMSMASLGKKKSKEHRLNMNKDKKGVALSQEHKEKLSKAHLGKKLSKEHIRKCLRRRPMSGLETKVQKVIDKHQLPYVFVGNGKFFIERKNPDFININGKKTAIEVYYKRHKNEFRNNGATGWMEERKQIFGKYGWQILFIEGTKLTERKILNIIEGCDSRE